MNIAIKDRLQEFPNDKDENIFKHRIQKVVRKGARIINIEQYKYKCFCFNGNLHSIKLEEEKFTNFLSSYDNKLSNILKKVFEKLYLEEYDFLEEFVLDEYEASEYTQESKRLKRIITKANNIDDNKLPQIHKFKPTKYKMKQDKRYDGIRLYVSCNTDGVIDLYLVDLYHLGIDAYNYITNKYELNVHYKKAEKYKCCISKMADNYIIKD